MLFLLAASNMAIALSLSEMLPRSEFFRPGVAPVCPDTRRRGLRPNELPGGDHSEPRVRVALVVIVEPPGDLPEHRSSIRQWMYASVVALECFDEGFSDAV